MTELPDIILALDVGEKRVGVAIASAAARIPRPLTTLSNDANFLEALQTVIAAEGAGALVIGLPRGLDGQSTQQTAYVTEFIAGLKQQIDLPMYQQDEALTSQKAETELAAKGSYAKGDIDALAATYILEDFLTEPAKSNRV